MAAELVTGTLSFFGREVIPAGLRPELAFIPSSAGIKGGAVFAAHRRVATLNPTTGAWSVLLESTDGVVPDVWYTATISYFRPDGSLSAVDEIGIEIRVPLGGGEIGSFPNVPLSPDSTWWSLTPPPESFVGFWVRAVPGDPDPGTETGDGAVFRVR